MSAGLAAGDVSDFGDALAADVVWWEIDSSEPVRGRDAVVERFSFVSDLNVSAELHDVVANDDHLTALLNVTASRGDENLNYQTAEIMHLDADGQVSERWAFSGDTQAIIDCFGSAVDRVSSSLVSTRRQALLGLRAGFALVQPHSSHAKEVVDGERTKAALFLGRNACHGVGCGDQLRLVDRVGDTLVDDHS